MDTTGQADERETVRLARSGDRAAFARLVDAYDPRLIYFIRRIVGGQEATLDVLQNVWLTVHRKLPGLKQVEAFRVWVYRVAHDLAVSELRRLTRQPISLEELEHDGAVADDSGTDRFDNAELVHVALQRLSVDHRRILTLRFLEDMTVEEIALVLNCSDGTVKSRLHYARHALRRHLEELQHG